MLLSLWDMANMAKCAAMEEVVCISAARNPPVKQCSILCDAARFGRLQCTSGCHCQQGVLLLVQVNAIQLGTLHQ